MNNDFNQLKEQLIEIAHLNSAITTLQWDEQVYMPTKGAKKRSDTLAYLAGLAHEKFLQLDKDGCLTRLANSKDKLTGDEIATVTQVWREYNRTTKLSTEFISELAGLTSHAHSLWVSARENNDWTLFEPFLEKLVRMKQQEAELVGYQDSPYDALVDEYEPGLSTKQLNELFTDLKQILIPLLQRISKSSQQIDTHCLVGNFPIEKQMEFNRAVAEAMGFDFEAGRIDASAHPFASGLHAEDVRLTTRYKDNDFLQSLLAIVHETGHGLYDQGVLVEHFGTPLGASGWYGLHESQSMIWEKPVGLSKPFWRHWYPKLQEIYPDHFKDVSFNDFYAAINAVSPSLIRVEADELTYILHVILRFEIERDLIEGTLAVKDIPQIWNAKMKEYLGVDVPNDTHGALQDVHWSSGYFGYFPVYAIGNLYAIQLFETAKKALPELEEHIAEGRFTVLREWLRVNVHNLGRKSLPSELITQLTGEPLSSSYFIKYIEKKYSEIYNLEN